MSYRIRWTRRALKRLEDIGDYIARDNKAAARRMVGLIASRIDNPPINPLKDVTDASWAHGNW